MTAADDSELARQLAELRRRVDEDNQAERRAWRPNATSMEALVLKVLGGWEMLKAEVNWAYFHSAGHDGPPAKSRELPATIRQVAITYNVRWPHDDWAATCARTNVVRQKLAHMLYVYKVDNESPSPNRRLAFMRLGKPESRRTVDGKPGELNFRDDSWSQQFRHIDAVTEEDLSQALMAIKWLHECVRFLQRLGNFLNHVDNPWPDDYVLPPWERDLLVWWFDEWGDHKTATVTAGQLRVTPLQRSAE